MQAIPATMQRSWMPLCWLGAALLLFALQLATGTEPLFAGLVFLFAVLSYHAVRAAGGLTTLMGACVAFMAGQNVLVSQIAKVAMGQAADHPLLCPLVTICLYDMAMAGIWLAAVLSARWAARRKPLLTGRNRCAAADVAGLHQCGPCRGAGPHTGEENECGHRPSPGRRHLRPVEPDLLPDAARRRFGDGLRHPGLERGAGASAPSMPP